MNLLPTFSTEKGVCIPWVLLVILILLASLFNDAIRNRAKDAFNQLWGKIQTLSSTKISTKK